jgi:hypothetical protein
MIFDYAPVADFERGHGSRRFEKASRRGRTETRDETGQPELGVPSSVMVRWASRLRAAGVRTAILSNMPVRLRAYLDAHAPWMPAFAHWTFSCGVRLAKLGTEIFLSCLEGLGAWSGDRGFWMTAKKTCVAPGRSRLNAR